MKTLDQKCKIFKIFLKGFERRRTLKKKTNKVKIKNYNNKKINITFK